MAMIGERKEKIEPQLKMEEQSRERGAKRAKTWKNGGRGRRADGERHLNISSSSCRLVLAVLLAAR
jgi:hypothetical protein